MTFPTGGVLVDKPVGPTSHDMVGLLRKTSGLRRVGHAGTLDPFASGLLLVLFGQATRLAEYLIGMDKAYLATARLGMETETHDPEGAVVRESASWQDIAMEDVARAAAGMTGPLAQRPPVFSAKKVGGESAHRRVRRGETVELDPVDVHVHEFAVVEFRPPLVDLTVRCSTGTYVRSLARDLGRTLGCGAHLTALRRIAIGPFRVEEAAPMDPPPVRQDLETRIIPPATLLGHLPAVELGSEEMARIRQGQFLDLPDQSEPTPVLVRALHEGELIAIALHDGGQLKPKKVLAHG